MHMAFLCSNLPCSQHQLHLSPPFLTCSQLYLMSGPNCFLLKYDLIFTPCCSISTFMLLLHINMLQTLPASPHDLHICASLSISSTYRCFFLRLWLSYVFPLLKARFVLTQTFLDLQLYISSCSLSSLQRCSQSPQNPIFGNWVHYVYYLTKPPPPLALLLQSISQSYRDQPGHQWRAMMSVFSLTLYSYTSPNSTGHKDHVHSLTKMS